MKVLLYPDTKFFMGGIQRAIDNYKKMLKMTKISYTMDLSKDFDILDIHLADPFSLILMKKAKLDGKKVVVHAHTTKEDFVNSFKASNGFSPIVRRYLKYFYNQADLVICPTEYTKNLLKYRYGVKNLIVISNGVDIDYFKPDRQIRQKARKKFNFVGTVVFSIGHIIPRKGVTSFIRIAKKFSNTFAWFGKFHGRLLTPKNLIKTVESSPPNVRFMGYVKDIRLAYSSGDIFLFPTRNENQGLVVLESASMQVPMLLRDLPVFREWEDEIDCLKARNDMEFSNKLKLLMNDKELRRKLVKNAYKKVLREHSLFVVKEKIKEAYERLI